MEQTLDWIQENYGSIIGYIRQGLGLEEAEVAHIRTELLRATPRLFHPNSGPGTPLPSEILELERVSNFRGLGASTNLVRPGQVFRTGMLDWLTKVDTLKIVGTFSASSHPPLLL